MYTWHGHNTLWKPVLYDNPIIISARERAEHERVRITQQWHGSHTMYRVLLFGYWLAINSDKNNNDIHPHPPHHIQDYWPQGKKQCRNLSVFKNVKIAIELRNDRLSSVRVQCVFIFAAIEMLTCFCCWCFVYPTHLEMMMHHPKKNEWILIVVTTCVKCKMHFNHCALSRFLRNQLRLKWMWDVPYQISMVSFKLHCGLSRQNMKKKHLLFYF